MQNAFKFQSLEEIDGPPAPTSVLSTFHFWGHFWIYSEYPRTMTGFCPPPPPRSLRRFRLWKIAGPTTLCCKFSEFAIRWWLRIFYGTSMWKASTNAKVSISKRYLSSLETKLTSTLSYGPRPALEADRGNVPPCLGSHHKNKKHYSQHSSQRSNGCKNVRSTRITCHSPLWRIKETKPW